MNRDSMVESLERNPGAWDIIIIGGGATGLGCAVDAASRGYATLLLDQHDFAKGTSSRSTKLVHGGVRYLRQGNISLVIEALHERGLLIQNAPHLVSNQSFVVPNYEWWDGPFYAAGMKVYDILSGKLGLGPSRKLSREETIRQIPNLRSDGLRGGVIYHDGQFDDSRLAVNLAHTAAEHGATLINYMKVEGLLKSGEMVAGVFARDMETGREYEIRGKAVVNATGVFADSVIRMDAPDARRIIAPSQGVHLVLDKEFLRGDSAIMVPHTDDGRVLFAVPWHNKVVVGTTDTPVEKPSLEPCALEEEIDFILRHAAKYMARPPERRDVLSVFAGLRPLVCPEGCEDTAAIARDFFLLVSRSGLVTMTGGKWTTYRKMGAEAIDHAVLVAGLEDSPSVTKHLRIHGWVDKVDRTDPLGFYGSDGARIRDLIAGNPELGEKLHPALPYTRAEVLWAVREEMARTVEDVLARRTRALLLDARAAVEAAPETAGIMAREAGKDESWQRSQVAEFTKLAGGYILRSS
ncbi:MAG: glycerol-3-phosphate dehydrogenase/oxidase [Desulfobacteraceae bacterium]|nr:glycerol-3-phosphate dehydrogenase/oxidase [Desulfobacteraceae bacterium]